MDAKADDTPRELVHDAQYPVALQRDGLAMKQIHAPQTVLHVSQEGQPGRSVAARSGVVVLS